MCWCWWWRIDKVMCWLDSNLSGQALAPTVRWKFLRNFSFWESTWSFNKLRCFAKALVCLHQITQNIQGGKNYKGCCLLLRYEDWLRGSWYYCTTGGIELMALVEVYAFFFWYLRFFFFFFLMRGECFTGCVLPSCSGPRQRHTTGHTTRTKKSASCTAIDNVDAFSMKGTYLYSCKHHRIVSYFLS